MTEPELDGNRVPELPRGERPMGGIRGWIRDLLKVPPPPEPPAGEPGSVRVFRAAESYYHYLILGWILKQVGAIVGLVWGLTFLQAVPDFPLSWMLRALEIVGIAFFVLLIPFSFLMLGLDFRLRWYVVTDRSLRIREGLVKVREQTMSFANVQNLSVRQGPLQRLLGIANLQVRTAGGSDGGQSGQGQGQASHTMHLGYFRGVDNAEEIRDIILNRLRLLKDAGLGDLDDANHEADHEEAPISPETSSGDADLLAAAKEVLTEARALRQAAGG